MPTSRPELSYILNGCTTQWLCEPYKLLARAALHPLADTLLPRAVGAV